MRLIALIETVCGAPFVAATVHESGVSGRGVQLPSSSFASYPLIAAPFDCSGASQLVVMDSSPATAETVLGAEGTAAGVAASTVDGPHPSEVHARTRTEYKVPFVNPARVIEVAVGPAVTVATGSQDPDVDASILVMPGIAAMIGGENDATSEELPSCTATFDRTSGTLEGRPSQESDQIDVVVSVRALTLTLYDRGDEWVYGMLSSQFLLSVWINCVVPP